MKLLPDGMNLDVQCAGTAWAGVSWRPVALALSPVVLMGLMSGLPAGLCARSPRVLVKESGG